jgi:hypothetical protein
MCLAVCLKLVRLREKRLKWPFFSINFVSLVDLAAQAGINQNARKMCRTLILLNDQASGELEGKKE